MADTKGSKSQYAKKIQRKGGHGRIDPRWMWWYERGTQPGEQREETVDEEPKERE